jgi:hypothetical protein
MTPPLTAAGTGGKPSQCRLMPSCPRPGFDRLLHRSHRSLARPLRLGRPHLSSAARRSLQRDRASHRGLDRPADRGGVPGRHRAVLPPPRSRHDLRPRLSATCEGHADPGDPHRPSEPVAEPLRGTAHRFGPARVCGPCPRAQREAPPPSLDPLLRLLSWRSNSPLTGEGCAGRQAHRAAGDGQGCAHSRSRWPASSLRPAGRIVPHRPASLPRPARNTPHDSPFRRHLVSPDIHRLG